MYIHKNYSLLQLNTFHLNSTARAYVSIAHMPELSELSACITDNTYEHFILGGGSNVLLPEYYNGIVIHNQMLGIQVVSKKEQEVIVKVMAGENWDKFVHYCLNHEWYGLENLSLIPGSVGAAPVQNIGAYGVEVAQFIDGVEVYDLSNKKFVYLSNKDCAFSYRSSIFKKFPQYLIVAVVFKLSKKECLKYEYADLKQAMDTVCHPTAQMLRDAVIKIRSQKIPDPKKIANVGSFFHNPVVDNNIAKKLKDKYSDLPVYQLNDNPDKVKISAGWLIDKLGLKGYKKGSLSVYNQQALVFVNNGNETTQTEVLKFAAIIQEKVFKHYGIELTIEPQVVE